MIRNNLLSLWIILALSSCKKDDKFIGIERYINQIKSNIEKYDTAYTAAEKYHSDYPNTSSVFDITSEGRKLHSRLNDLGIEDMQVYGEGILHFVFKSVVPDQNYTVSISKDFKSYLKDTVTSDFIIIQMDSTFVLFAEKDS